MTITGDTVVDTRWLGDLLYYFVTRKQYSYCFVLQHVDIVATMQPFAFCGQYPVPAACCVTSTGQLSLMLYWPIVSRISFEARLQLLQHEALHIAEGHMSSFGLSLSKKYGQFVANMAMDIYVNQKMQRDKLEAEGLPGVTFRQFGFPPDLSSVEYAELLKKLVDAGKLEDVTLTPNGYDSLAGTAGQPGDKFTGKGIKGIPSELFQLDEQTAILADETVKTIIASVTEALKAYDETTFERWRGSMGADYAEFIKASKRDAVIPWSFHLRALESQCRSDFRVYTRRRPSRRHPAYHGQTWRNGLDIVFLIDTSASMGIEELKLIAPELRGIYARGAKITIIHSDANVAKVHEYNPHEPLENFVGRGGTDYSNALLYIRQMYPKPNCLIGYTDGFGSAAMYESIITKERGQKWWTDYVSTSPEESPDGMKSLWLLPADCMSPEAFKRDVIPWGTAIVVAKGPV